MLLSIWSGPGAEFVLRFRKVRFSSSKEKSSSKYGMRVLLSIGEGGGATQEGQSFGWLLCRCCSPEGLRVRF